MKDTIRIIAIGEGKLNLNEDIDSDDNLEVIFENEFYTFKHILKNIKDFKNKSRHQYLVDKEVWEYIQKIKYEQNNNMSLSNSEFYDDDNTIYVQGYNYGEVDVNSLRRKYGGQI